MVADYRFAPFHITSSFSDIFSHTSIPSPTSRQNPLIRQMCQRYRLKDTKREPATERRQAFFVRISLFAYLPPTITTVLTVADEVPSIESCTVSGIAVSVMAGVVGVSDSASLRIFPSSIQSVTVASLFLAAVAVVTIPVIVIAVVVVISIGVRVGTVYPALAFQQGALPLALALQFPGAPLFVVTPLIVVALRISPPGFMPILLSVSLEFRPDLTLWYLKLRLSLWLNSGLYLTFRTSIIALRLMITPILRLSC